jgi:hypothetical protein
LLWALWWGRSRPRSDTAAAGAPLSAQSEARTFAPPTIDHHERLWDRASEIATAPLAIFPLKNWKRARLRTSRDPGEAPWRTGVATRDPLARFRAEHPREPARIAPMDSTGASSQWAKSINGAPRDHLGSAFTRYRLADIQSSSISNMMGSASARLSSTTSAALADPALGRSGWTATWSPRRRWAARCP